MNFGKYKRQYFMPPTPTYDWVKKEYIDKYGPLTQAEGKYKDGYMDYVTKPSAWLGD